MVIVSTLSGPVFAVQSQKWIERARETRNRQLWIFHTLMATRAVRASSIEHIQALNLIDLVFSRKSGKEQRIRAAWNQYHDYLLQTVPENMNPNEARAYNEKGVDFLVSLLETLSQSLGYSFSLVELKRGGYYPQGQFDDINNRAQIRDELLKIVRGEKPFPMAVVQFPVSEEAIKTQRHVNEALLKMLSGESPLQIKSSR